MNTKTSWLALLVYVSLSFHCTAFASTGASGGGETRYDVLLEMVETEHDSLIAIRDNLYGQGFTGMADELDSIARARFGSTPEDEKAALRQLNEIKAEAVEYTKSGGYLDKASEYLSVYRTCQTALELYSFARAEKLTEDMEASYASLERTKREDVAGLTESLTASLHAYKYSELMADKDGTHDVSLFLSTPSLEGPVNCLAEGWTCKDLSYMRIKGVLYALVTVWPWETPVKMYQTVTGLPAGRYRLSSCLGGERDTRVRMRAFIETKTAGAVSRDQEGEALKNEYIYGCWEPLDTTVWDSVTTEEIPVLDGVTVGLDAYEAYRSLCDFIVRRFYLIYCGPLTADTCLSECEKLRDKYAAVCDSLRYGGDKARHRRLLEAMTFSPLTADSLTAIYRRYSAYYDEASAIVASQDGPLNGAYASLRAGLDAGSYTGKAREIVEKALSVFESSVEGDGTTFERMDSMSAALSVYKDKYLKTLADVAGTTISTRKYAIMLRLALNSHVADVLSSSLMFDAAWVQERDSVLADLRVQVLAADVIETSASDMSGLLVNSTFDDGLRGWSVSYGLNGSANSGEAVLSRSRNWTDLYDNYYASLVDYVREDGTKAKGMTFSQSVQYLPNGLYTVEIKSCSGELVGDEGWCLYGIADGDEDSVVLCRLSHKASVNEEGKRQIWYSKYGTVWERACQLVDSGKVEVNSDMERASYANNGHGYGWCYYTFDIEVRNHRLEVGLTCDRLLTAGRRDFHGEKIPEVTSGSNVNVDDFVLTLKREGDNAGWSPTVDISLPELDGSENPSRVVSTAYVSLSGAVRGTPWPGVNIVVKRMSDGTTVRCKQHFSLK